MGQHRHETGLSLMMLALNLVSLLKAFDDEEREGAGDHEKRAANEPVFYQLGVQTDQQSEACRYGQKADTEAIAISEINNHRGIGKERVLQGQVRPSPEGVLHPLLKPIAEAYSQKTYNRGKGISHQRESPEGAEGKRLFSG